MFQFQTCTLSDTQSKHDVHSTMLRVAIREHRLQYYFCHYIHYLGRGYYSGLHQPFTPRLLEPTYLRLNLLHISRVIDYASTTANTGYSTFRYTATLWAETLADMSFWVFGFRLHLPHSNMMGLPLRANACTRVTITDYAILISCPRAVRALPNYQTIKSINYSLSIHYPIACA